MAQTDRRLTPPPGARRSQLMRQRARAAWLFLTPMLVVLAAVAGWPLLRTIYFSFTDASLTDLEARHWVGFANYFSVLHHAERHGSSMTACWSIRSGGARSGTRCASR